MGVPTSWEQVFIAKGMMPTSSPAPIAHPEIQSAIEDSGSEKKSIGCCLMCKKDFIRPKPRKKYCESCDEERSKMVFKSGTEGSCRKCGLTFVLKYSRSRYCEPCLEARREEAMKSPVEIACNRCGKVFACGNSRRKYCDPCKAQQRKETFDRYSPKRKPPSSDALKSLYEDSKCDIVEAGRQRSLAACSDNAWSHRHLCFVRYIKLVVPWSKFWSKNALFTYHSNGSKPVIGLKHEVKRLRDNLTDDIKLAAASNPFVQGKVWLDFLVQKPNNCSDAVNVLDSMCDAIKVGIGVDDRWFCVSRIDWEVAKDDPQVFIGIGQEINEDHQICSYCGISLPYSLFGPNRSTKSGINRECRPCRLAADSIRRSKKSGSKTGESK